MKYGFEITEKRYFGTFIYRYRSFGHDSIEDAINSTIILAKKNGWKPSKKQRKFFKKYEMSLLLLQ